MHNPNQRPPKWVSKRQLAAVGLTLIRLEPLIVQCQICGAEWQPLRLPALHWWLCHNGCNQSSEH